jgi:hypothetical protein
MLLIVLIFMFNNVVAMDRQEVVLHSVSNIARELGHEDICDAALQSFMRRTDSDLAKYIRPQLVSFVKEAASSPESEDEGEQASPSPKKIARRLAASPDAIRTAQRHEIDEVVLAAVQKAFEEKEADIEHKAKKIEGMFSKKCMAGIATCVGIFATLATSLASVYGTLNNAGNCTK